MSSASPTSGNRIIKTTELSAWFGIICLVCGLSTLSVSDSINKLLSSLGYHVVMIAWLRFTGNAVFMLFTMVPLYQRRTGRSILKTNNLRLQIARGCVLLLSSLIFFSMLRFMPIAEATALNFCAPLIVLAVSPWLLKEALSLPRWIDYWFCWHAHCSTTWRRHPPIGNHLRDLFGLQLFCFFFN
jgi:drug/metabolite transporter (DMT)-like permease